MDKHKDYIFENHTEQQIIKAVIQLLHGLFDKNESFRIATETSVVSMAEHNTDLVIGLILDFREKTPKVDEKQLAILYQLIETIIRRFGKIDEKTMKKLVKTSVEEIMKIADLIPAVQKPIIDTLVVLSHMNSDIVITGILEQLVQGQPVHFMLLHTLGELSTANTKDIIKYLRNIFSLVIATMEMVKNDHLKQAYSFAIGKFCETITENISELKNPVSPPNPFEEAPADNEEGNETTTISTDNATMPPLIPESLDFASEAGIAYDVIVQQWLSSRESKVCTEVLLCLSHIFPLLRPEKVADQIGRFVPALLGLYRKTNIDRLSITKCLGATIHTTVRVNPQILDPVSSQLIASLFDLISVNPDYEKPQTIKGHYEVLRCFDVLTQKHYETIVMETVMTQLRSNMERDRIKSLQLLVHFCSTHRDLVETHIEEFTKILRQMITTERMIRMKVHLLKTIVAFALKGFIRDKAFVKFVLRFSCQLSKSSEFGTEKEQLEFMQTCNDSLYILSSTVGTVDEILKRELLSALMLPDYITAGSTITKCLAKLFEKSKEIESELLEGGSEDQVATLTAVPEPMAVFVRCLILLDNPAERKRTNHILVFLKEFAPIINKHVQTLWNERIVEYLNALNKRKEGDRKAKFVEIGPQFLLETIKDIDEIMFAERVIAELKVQRGLISPVATNQPQVTEFKVIYSNAERGNLYKLLGVCLSQVDTEEELNSGIELLIEMAKVEKMDKNTVLEETIIPALSSAFGFASRKHFSRVLNDLMQVLQFDTKKSSSGMFSKLNFVKENQKEAEMFKMRTFVLLSLQHVVDNFPKIPEYLKFVEEDLIEPLLVEFHEVQNVKFREKIIKILLEVCQNIYDSFPEYEMRTREKILKSILTVEIGPDNLQLLPTILILGTILIKMNVDSYNTIMNDHEIIQYVCSAFFSIAQGLKTRFDSHEEDVRNSFIAGHLNDSLPQLIAFVQVIVEQNPTPACLDVITTIVEKWSQDNNSEVRICASHVIKAILNIYIKTMKFGGEAPSKFNQTGLMVGKTVPRCIDSNATVRQISVDILRKILEIACIYETFTIPTEETDWVKELARIRMEILTNDSNEILKLTNNIAEVIAERLPQIQYKHFCSTLVLCVNDPEQSSAIGASVVLMYFLKIKGQLVFHNLTGFVDECLTAIGQCQRDEAKMGLMKALVALTKHFPQQMCNEMLNQDLPFSPLHNHYWRLLCKDGELALIVVDYFLATLNTSCLYDTSEKQKFLDPVAASVPLKIFYALKEMLLCSDNKTVSSSRFEELFIILIASLACYIKTGPPVSDKLVPVNKSKSTKPPPPLQLPAQTILDIIEGFLTILDMEQLRQVFNICPDLAETRDLRKLVELIAPMAVALGNTLGIHSNAMKKFVQLLSKFTSSTYEAQRIASVSLLCQFLTLSPTGEVLSTIMLHLNSSLNDPNLLARCSAVKGLGNLRYLNEHDANMYMETSLIALISALDVSSEDPTINIPLESLNGLTQIIGMAKIDNLKMYTINVAIRIKPFMENQSAEIRKMAIGLFGQLCEQQSHHRHHHQHGKVPEEFEEQVHKYFFPLLLHLSETEGSIVVAVRNTVKKAVHLMENKPKIAHMIEENLLDYGNLNYDIFITDLLKLVNAEFSLDLLQQFIESCMPFLKSRWPELRGNAIVMIALLGNYLNTHPELEKSHEAKHRTLTLNHLADTVTGMLKDENLSVRVKAALSMGHLFANI